MDRSIRSVLCVVCAAALLISISLAKTLAEAPQNSVTFEPIPAGDYKMDPNHSVIGFSIRHFELSLVSGRFKDFTGTIHYDAADVAKSTVEFTAKIESI